MHRALEIAEVLDAVLLEMHEEARFQDLTAMALVARCFHLPAASYIWKRVKFDAIRSLFRTLSEPAPSDIHSLKSVDARYARFETLTDFVRVVDIGLETENTAELLSQMTTALITTSARRASLALLPRLRSLELTRVDSGRLKIAIPLITPTLEEVNFSFPSDDSDESRGPDMISFFYALRCGAPRLNELSLRGVPGPWVSGDFLGDLVSSLPSLLRFHCDGNEMTPALFQALSELSSLHDLTFQDASAKSPFAAGPIRSPSLSSRAFPSLRTVRIVTCDLEPAARALSIINKALEELYIEVFLGDDFSETLDTVMDAIRLSSQRLQKLELRFGMATNSIFAWKSVSSILHCSSVTHFNFSLSYLSRYHGAFNFEDCHLADIATAWTSMQSLSISWPLPEDEDSPSGLVKRGSFSLAGLTSLATHCPKLRFLRLATIAAPGDVLVSIPPRPAAHNLELDLVHVETGDIPAAAFFLDALWPNISVSDDVKTSQEENGVQLKAALVMLRRYKQFRSKLEALASVPGGSHAVKLDDVCRS